MKLRFILLNIILLNFVLQSDAQIDCDCNFTKVKASTYDIDFYQDFLTNGESSLDKYEFFKNLYVDITKDLIIDTALINKKATITINSIYIKYSEFPNKKTDKKNILKLFSILKNRNISELVLINPSKYFIELFQKNSIRLQITSLNICKSDFYFNPKRPLTNVIDLTIACLENVNNFDLSAFNNVSKIVISCSENSILKNSVFNASLSKLKLKSAFLEIGNNEIPRGILMQDNINNLGVITSSLNEVDEIKFKNNLKTLFFKLTKIIPGDSLSYPNYICSFKNLEELKLTATEGIFPFLPSEIGNLTQLTTFTALCDTRNFPESFNKIKNLKEIRIDRKPVYQLMPKSFLNFDKVMENNLIIFPFFNSIHENFSAKEIKSLHIKYFENFPKIDLSFTNLPNFRRLDISNFNEDYKNSFNFDTIPYKEFSFLSNIDSAFALNLSGKIYINSWQSLLTNFDKLKCLELNAVHLLDLKTEDDLKVFENLYFLCAYDWYSLNNYLGKFKEPPYLFTINRDFNLFKSKYINTNITQYSDITSIDKYYKLKTKR